MGVKAVAKAAGISTGSMSKLVYGLGNRGPTKRIRPETEVVAAAHWGPRTRECYEEILCRAPRLRWLHTLSAGVNHLPLEALHRAGVVVTLHDLTMALRLADRVVVLAAGAVLADGAPVDALRPDVLRAAYGIEARVLAGAQRPIIDVVRRAG